MHDEILMNIMLSLNGIKDILYKTAPWYQSLTPFVTAAIGALLAYLLGQHKDKIRSKKEQVKIKKALFYEIKMIVLKLALKLAPMLNNPLEKESLEALRYMELLSKIFSTKSYFMMPYLY